MGDQSTFQSGQIIARMHQWTILLPITAALYHCPLAVTFTTFTFILTFIFTFTDTITFTELTYINVEDHCLSSVQGIIAKKRRKITTLAPAIQSFRISILFNRIFSLNQPLGRFSLVFAMSVCLYIIYLYVVPWPWNLFWGLSLANTSHMITSRAFHCLRHRVSKSSAPTQSLCGSTKFWPWCTVNWPLANTGHMITSQAFYCLKQRVSKLSAATHSLCGSTQVWPWFTLNWPLANTGHMITSQTSHWSKHQG